MIRIGGRTPPANYPAKLAREVCFFGPARERHSKHSGEVLRAGARSVNAPERQRSRKASRALAGRGLTGRDPVRTLARFSDGSVIASTLPPICCTRKSPKTPMLCFQEVTAQ
jgi:hypothetical protein